MADPDNDFLTVAEVAERLRVNPQTVRNWIDRGELPALRPGGRRVRVEQSALETFVGIQSEAGVSRRTRKQPASQLPPEIDREAAAAALEQIGEGVIKLAHAIRGNPLR